MKTLHPNVHAGLLADLRLASHEAQLGELGIRPFELVVVNLYPFVETVASGAEGDDVVEQIDIGGPAMVRASAKNHANVAIVVSPESYPAIIDALQTQGGTNLVQRRELAARAFSHTAAYDTAVSTWFAEGTLGDDIDLPRAPDDPGRAPVDPALTARTRTSARRSTRASADTASPRPRSCRARRCRTTTTSTPTRRFARPSTWSSPPSRSSSTRNPCGIAVAAPNALDPIASAHLRAHECDPVSAFGA